MASLSFVKGQGGLARPIPGQDHVSGMLLYMPAANYAYRRRSYTSLGDAIADGILDADTSKVDPTAGTIVVGGTPAITDVITVKLNGETIAVAAGGASVNATATNIYNAINARTAETGISATNGTAGTATILAAGFGARLSSGTPITVSATGNGTYTVTQLSGGTEGQYKILYYHIKEFFRINPSGVLWLYTASASAVETTFAEVEKLQTLANGACRQIAVWQKFAFATAHITTLQAKAALLEAAYRYCNIVYAADMSAITGYSSLADLRALAAPKVSCVIGEDGGNEGAALFAAANHSISCIGAVLGAISKASVSENIGWVKSFNIGGTEIEIPAFSYTDTSRGRLVKSYSAAEITAIDAKGYIFALKYDGISGSYFNDSHTATPLTGDYAYIENGRTIDKAIRGMRTYILPELNGPLQVDATSGKLSLDTCKYFEAIAAQALEQMARNGELSGFEVGVDPDQDVLSTSQLAITASLVPVGVARAIVVTIGFTTSV